MTKEEMLRYMSRESIIREEIGQYAIEVIKDYLPATAKKDGITTADICSMMSETEHEFFYGLGAMALAYLSVRFPEEDEADIRMDFKMAAEILEEYRKHKHLLAELSLPEQIDYAISVYS